MLAASDEEHAPEVTRGASAKRDVVANVSVQVLEIPLPTGGAQVVVDIYGSVADARRPARDFEPIERDQTDQIEVRAQGANLSVGSFDESPAVPQDKFDAAVTAVEGG
jgi:hypothetical protein